MPQSSEKKENSGQHSEDRCMDFFFYSICKKIHGVWFLKLLKVVGSITEEEWVKWNVVKWLDSLWDTT